MKDKEEIIFYQSENTLQLEARLENEIVWLTQALMFQSIKQNINLHINNIFKERELHKESVVK
ncbi:hypothetical protein [Parabacteroides gordonii]|jgi:hypothetical protein|uniref:hypothetical protein n=1 Tax=Parabacteroides gordonii TaxID=574930 RepID=UPI00241F310B|nr:hypothetical protein [Parabacteroides gordonii]